MSRDQPGERWASGSSLASHCQGIRPQTTVYQVPEGGQAFQTSWYFLSSLTSNWLSSYSGSKVTTHTSSMSSWSTWSSALLVLLLPDSLHACLHIVWCGPEPGLPASTKHLTLLVLKSRKWKWKKYRGKLSNQELSPPCLDVDQPCLWHGSSPKRLGILRLKTTRFVMRQRH